MKLQKIGSLAMIAAFSASAFAATDTPGAAPLTFEAPSATAPTTLSTAKRLDEFTVAYAEKAQAAPVVAAATYFLKPRVGIRVGGGDWTEFMIEGGVDVTFNVPLIPLPAIRVDGEVWGKPSNFGKDTRGNAVSILGVQTFMLGYAGLGPTYYFTDNDGDHKSGFGAKVLVGINLPASAYVEAELLVGPSTPPVFVSVGMRF